MAGGFALLAASAVTSNVAGGAAAAAVTGGLGLGAAGIAPILGGLGLVGAAGVGLMAMSECGGPTFCVASSGQCCFLGLNVRGQRACPQSC